MNKTGNHLEITEAIVTQYLICIAFSYLPIHGIALEKTESDGVKKTAGCETVKRNVNKRKLKVCVCGTRIMLKKGYSA